MIHWRGDYSRRQDPGVTDPDCLPPGATPIAEDEPVILISGRDRHAHAMAAGSGTRISAHRLRAL
jgi:hypothetical protein